MLYGPFARVNNAPVPLGLDQEIVCIVRLIADARARRAAIAPTAAPTEKFLAHLGAAFPATVWVGGCKNWYTDRSPRRSCGPSRKASTRRSWTGCRSRIFSSSRQGGETDFGCARLRPSFAFSDPGRHLIVAVREVVFGNVVGGGVPDTVMTKNVP